MECRKEENLKNCSCSKLSCPRRGFCCECVNFHRTKGGLPACFFSTVAERTHDRSIKKFIEDHKEDV